MHRTILKLAQSAPKAAKHEWKQPGDLTKLTEPLVDWLIERIDLFAKGEEELCKAVRQVIAGY